MTSKLIPSDPSKVMVIRQVTPNITTCSAPFLRFGRLKIGGRGTIVRLQSGALAVFSPTALTPEVRSVVESMGNKVGYIAALDYEHHIFITDWAVAFPSAKLLGVEGLPEKRGNDNATAGSSFQHVWTQKYKASMKVDPDFDKEFDYEYVGSHANKELVLCHRPDRTLIEADMMFNLPANEQFSRTGEDPTSGIFTKLFIGLQNTVGTAQWQKRFLWYAASAGDRQGFNESAKRIASWDFDRIIPCHGDVIERGGKGIFNKVFDWHLNASAK
ncbi:MAG: hypothetical protein ALECFALPRED_008069 [Alectoria fallacina]|uniref:Uncharacterized protein n=1 Tax=Alectoria fallacina TaxID=1903189 RepID=A0A8H3PFL5_9LECA|nr:MAG: hypothetical protein ALECFALPRED_008069 [Alectoria fallacina]